MKRAQLVPLALTLSAMAAIHPAAAAGPTPGYNAGSAIKEAAPPKAPSEKEVPAPELPVPVEQPLALPDGKTLFVRQFRLEGANLPDQEELSTLLTPYNGRELTLAEIYEAAGRITTACRNRGYLLARAYVPQQDASDGTVTIKVMIGQYGNLYINNASPVADFLMEGVFADDIAPGAPVRQEELERAMLLASDLPGARMPKVTIAPGATPGTSDFVVDAQPAKRLEGYVLSDNYGSRYTGRKRLSAGTVVNSPFSLGDRLSLSGVTSPGAGLQSGAASYSFPLSYSGLRAELTGSRVTYRLGDAYRDLEAEGHADTIEGALSYPVIRTSAETLRAQLGVGFRRLQDKVWGETLSMRKAAVSRFGLNNETTGTLFGLDATTTAGATYTLGRLSFYDSDEREANESSAHTVGDYSKAELGLGGTVNFDAAWSLSTTFSAQKAIGKNLDSSEQMNISGPNAVIAYPTGIMGDNAYVFSASLKYNVPSPTELYEHNVSLFFDQAHSYLEDPEYTETAHAQTIADIGVGYSARLAYSDERHLLLNLRLAQGVGPKPNGTEATQRTKVLGQIGLTF
ncbi:MAG: ShlB/FhaC/HecB family hemolysin secretion/activation protein [Bacteroidota bacterium]